MGRVVVAVRVNPLSDEVDLEELTTRIRRSLPPQYEFLKSEKFYIAFGLYGLRVYVAMPEEYEGGTYELENVLSGVEGVASVDIEYVTRLFTE
ncbi:MAG: elongation factor 1-beta [Sulfolobales archaeon]|nr:elongation factor 1-beta [Sulfolobales archaeon]MCX8208426.1 elongation factor 1-beta [Sulfolobales archaeon]MDW8010729.1 elongation factor 1-beta [Sulfolobales archaeon]